MFTTIACAADGSPPARDALTIATDLARILGGRIVVIYVQEVTISRAGFLVDDPATLAELRRTVDRMRDNGIDADLRWARSTTRDAPRVIVDLATQAGADVLVVGNRGLGPLSNIVIGSVTTRLLQLAPWPVIMAPPRPTAPPRAPVRDHVTDPTVTDVPQPHPATPRSQR